MESGDVCVFTNKGRTWEAQGIDIQDILTRAVDLKGLVLWEVKPEHFKGKVEAYEDLLLDLCAGGDGEDDPSRGGMVFVSLTTIYLQRMSFGKFRDFWVVQDPGGFATHATVCLVVCELIFLPRPPLYQLVLV